MNLALKCQIENQIDALIRQHPDPSEYLASCLQKLLGQTWGGDVIEAVMECQKSVFFNDEDERFAADQLFAAASDLARMVETYRPELEAAE